MGTKLLENATRLILSIYVTFHVQETKAGPNFDRMLSHTFNYLGKKKKKNQETSAV
jgi:hypothetical protein